jgi:tetratricopeptide (TPR) repeat protein
LCETIDDLQGRHDSRRTALDQAAQLAAQLDECTAAQAQVAARLAKLAIDLGDYGTARAHAQGAVSTLEASPQGPVPHAQQLVDALLLHARASFFEGQAASARPQLERALALARAHPYPRGQYNAMSMIGLLHWHCGDYDAASDWLGQSVRLIEQEGDARRQLDILNNLGVVAHARAHFVQARQHYEAAQAIARRIGDRSGQAMLLNNLGSTCLEAGDLHQAGLHAEQAARLYAQLNEPAQHGFALLNRAEAHRGLGQYAAAQDLSEQALALLTSSGHRQGVCIVRDNLGLLALAQGRHHEALHSAQAALLISREIGSRALEAGILLHLGRAHTAAGQAAHGRVALDTAATIAQELAAEPLVLEAQAAQAELALAAGRPGCALQAREAISTLLPLLLPGAAASAAQLALPMWVHVTAYRVLVACTDPRAAALLEHARDTLRARSERIPDAVARRDYLRVAEHQALLPR